MLSYKSKICQKLFQSNYFCDKKRNFRLYNMTDNEKKALYESIIKDVAKIIKR